MPSFCRHNRLVQNCPICSKEQDVEMRAIVSSSAPAVNRSSSTRTGAEPGGGGRSASASGRGGTRTAPGVRVRRLARGADDGYHSGLVPGLRSSSDAERLAEELAFAVTRLELLASEPPGLYAEVARGFDGDPEERTWLAFQIACLGPLDGPDPFEAIERARVPWSGGAEPELAGVDTGPRSAIDPVQPVRTFAAYRAWAERSGSQAAAFAGDPSWTPERRFARLYERLALPGLHREARFDLLVTLGRLGLYELRAGSLALGGDNPVTVAAKRALGIGDPLLLDRRAAALADACAVDLEALDVALFNWERGARSGLGVPADAEPDGELLGAIRDALRLD